MESDLVFLSQISDSSKKDQNLSVSSNVSNSSRISTRASIIPYCHGHTRLYGVSVDTQLEDGF